jgi:spore coat polysaccharide biosynthesis protein SpsF
MNVTAIIQARMGSTRLPGKVMKVLGDRTVLAHVISRVKAVPSITRVVVATTVLPEDAAIAAEARRYGAHVYRGSEKHVLSRYYKAATEVQADVVVRFTSDCPLLDPAVADRVIRTFLDGDYDYARLGLETHPRGLDVEVFTYEVLKQAYGEATKEYEFEHVTTFILERPDRFKIARVQQDSDESRYRLTLDTPEDWQLIANVYGVLYKGEGHIFSWPEVKRVLLDRPDWVQINAGVKQKKPGE